jgi:hypothetical protein
MKYFRTACFLLLLAFISSFKKTNQFDYIKENTGISHRSVIILWTFLQAHNVNMKEMFEQK